MASVSIFLQRPQRFHNRQERISVIKLARHTHGNVPYGWMQTKSQTLTDRQTDSQSVTDEYQSKSGNSAGSGLRLALALSP
jgi:hypothetical protein